MYKLSTNGFIIRNRYIVEDIDLKNIMLANYLKTIKKNKYVVIYFSSSGLHINITYTSHLTIT